MSTPTVTLTGYDTVLTMFADQLDGDQFAIVLKDDSGDSVHLAFTKNYEAVLDVMDTFITSFAVLGYDFTTKF